MVIGYYCCMMDIKEMYVSCKLCGKEFNDLLEGVRYSSVNMGILVFCSDNCCKEYLVKAANK